MSENYIEEKDFDGMDYSENPLPKGDYENCNFTNCVFANSDLAGIKFTDCSFTGCNISMANIHGTAFRDIQFKDCKLMGLHFENCNPFLFSATYQNCILTLSSFYKQKLKKTKFSHSNLQEVDFSEADLTEAAFDNCDLLHTTFQQSILEKADFRTAYNYSINPEINRVKKAKFSTTGIAGLLDKYQLEIEP